MDLKRRLEKYKSFKDVVFGTSSPSCNCLVLEDQANVSMVTEQKMRKMTSSTNLR